MIELVELCSKCQGRQFIVDDGQGRLHTETGMKACPKRPAPGEVKRIMERIIERDAELLRRLADG